MKRAPSLALRIAALIFVAHVFGMIMTGLALEILAASGSLHLWDRQWNDLAENRTKNLVVESLRRSPDGDIEIVPSAALREELRRAPTLKFAAIDPVTRRPASGSSPEIASLFSTLGDLQSSHMGFSLRSDPRPDLRGHMVEAETPFGPLLVASYGHRFKWTDMFVVMHDMIADYLQYFVFEVIFAAGLAWFALKRSLSPLHTIELEARRINFHSLDKRLPLAGAPDEISTLVSSMNAALDRLDEGAKRQRRFLANAAHELRTPVAILTERLNQIGEPAVKSDLQRDSRRIRYVVEQLLASARYDRREHAPDAKVDLIEVARSAVDDFALIAAKAGRQLALEIDAHPAIVGGDQQAIECVVANLVDNALRAEPPGGTVIVRVVDNASIDVVDHGDGVAAADREKIFEPFWRKTEAAPGTGLGLAIAREIMDQHDGAIEIHDTPGGGVTFRICLGETIHNATDRTRWPRPCHGREPLSLADSWPEE